jgi:O-acetyl-ADP-ribose deacetylase (regulator of RNase III)
MKEGGKDNSSEGENMRVRADLKVVLVDVNPAVVRAWQTAFADSPEVRIFQGSILEQRVDAWVTPTNARGKMDGGLDAVLKRHFGAQIEKAVQKEIRRLYEGHLPVGCAVCVPTGETWPRFLISTPTMERSAENISETHNVALACAAAFQAIHQQNRTGQGSITSVALPGLGTRTGGVPVLTCAHLMWTAYNLFTDYEFRNFETMRAGLAEQLDTLASSAEATRMRIQLPPDNDWVQ